MRRLSAVKRMSRARRALKKTRRLAKLLLRRARTERASPKEVGHAVFIGVFSGCSPAVGLHGWIAIGLASLLKKNRLYAWIGSRVSNMVVLPFIVVAEVQSSRLLRTGHLAPITRDHVLDQAPALMLDWILGSIVVGGALGLVLGALAYAWALRREKRNAVAAPPPAEPTAAI